MSGQSLGLDVMFAGAKVGQIGRDGDRFTFKYDSEWLKQSEAFAISLRLPLRQAAFGTEEAHPFFANLLPEGSVRLAITRRLKLSADNDYALLRALGGDCAGALSIHDPDDVNTSPMAPGELRPLPTSTCSAKASPHKVCRRRIRPYCVSPCAARLRQSDHSASCSCTVLSDGGPDPSPKFLRVWHKKSP